MTDTFLEEVEHALASHGAFERGKQGFVATTTPFDATVRLDGTESGVHVLVAVTVPTIDEAVDGESVAEVVEEGWFETFERRIRAVSSVTNTEPTVETVEMDRVLGEVTVEIAIETTVARQGADDAKALVDFVEGTYVQGIIPGYEYRDPVASLIDRARARSEGGDPDRTPL